MIQKTCPPWIVKRRAFQQGVAHAVDTIFLKEAEKTRGYKQHRESVLIPNLDMIFDKCRDKKLTAEQYVLEKLKRMGYEVIDCRQYGEGHPDFIVIKDNKRAFIEVKSTNDGLSMSQGKWIMKNPEKKVIIYWVDI